MRTRRTTPTPAISFLLVALLGALAAWMGCSASGSTLHTGGTGGASTGSNQGGAGVGGGGGADGGDAGDGDAGPMCTSSEKLCNGMCVAASDPQYGCDPMVCGMPCPAYPNAGVECSGGACALGPCNAGFKNCDGMDSNGCETDILNNPAQCGACGSPCVLVHATPTCDNGVCKVKTCDTGGWTDCSGADGGAPDGGMGPDIGCNTNVNTDPGNCGMCGKACPGMESCSGGTCGLVCPKGFADCDNDPMDPDGCETMLGTNKNCAMCDDCTLPNSQTQCMMVMGTNTCTITMCDPGWGNCDGMSGNGCETNINTDPGHCGGCGNLPCASGPHSTPVCNAGTCEIVCDPGYADCNHNPSDGCEVNLGTDPNNCNACGMACSQNHATETCVAGLCQIVTCSSGWKDCNVNPADGCEDNTQTDPNNCGTCGTICKTQNGTPTCTQGMCAVGSCNTGYSHCPGQPGTNCETATGTDVNNCGTCGNVCSNNNDTPSCTGGTCILNCNPGYANCDGMLGNGCETSTTNVNNCGSCSNLCTTQNGTPTCNTATNPPSCAVGSCSMGYASCPGNGNNCLTYIGGSDTNNCGGCGVTCATQNGTPVCVGGSCKAGACNPGWGNCPGDGANCSTPLNTVSNCGGCGVVCTTQNGTPACNFVGGFWTCQAASCNSGFADCPGDGSNCSTNTNTDNANCGGCGIACNANTCGGSGEHVATTTCTSGKCEITACAGNWQDTDGQCSDGCECALSTVPSTCGPGSYSLGSFPVGAQPVSHTSNLFPAAPNAAYYVATFSGNTNTSYHPKITLTDPLNEFVMDVTSDCSTAVNQCNTAGDHGSSTGITSWDTSYTGGDPNSLSPGGTSNFIAIPPVGNNGTLYIKVYRKGGVSNCNNAYTITASG